MPSTQPSMSKADGMSLMRREDRRGAGRDRRAEERVEGTYRVRHRYNALCGGV